MTGEQAGYEIGDIFQVKPSCENKPFRTCLVICSEVKSFGIMGYVLVPSENTSMAYVRMRWEDLVFCGKAMFISGYEDEEEIAGWIKTESV